MDRYELIETRSPSELEEMTPYGANGVDFNENGRVETREETRFEDGNPVIVEVTEHVYDTYRFTTLADGYDWKHEKELEEDRLANAEAIVGLYETISGGSN